MAGRKLVAAADGQAWRSHRLQRKALWHLLAEAVLKEVAGHSSCRAAGPPLKEGRQAQTTAERGRQVHDLTDKGTGLLECSRRLGLSLNTVKRYARAAEPGRMIRAPRYRPAQADPYRDHLRARRAQDPAVPVHRLLAEIREQATRAGPIAAGSCTRPGRLPPLPTSPRNVLSAVPGGLISEYVRAA